MSGTLTKTSIKDYEHLAEIALGEGTPLPRASKDWSTLEAWSACLDPSSGSSYAEGWQWEKIQPLNTVFGDGRKLTEIYPLDARRKQARKAFYERLRTTPGVVHTSRDTVGASIEITPITDMDIPGPVREAMQRVDKEYVLPNDDEIEDPLAKSRALKQLAQGVYYIWDWPGEPDLEWLEARREKAREIRRAIKEGPRMIDSPALVIREIEDGDAFAHDHALMAAWRAWQPHAHKDPPPTVPVWMSDYMIDDVIERSSRRGSVPPALIWYQHRYVAHALEDRGIDVYWPDEDRNPEEADPGDGPIALSIHSHTEGLNLQHAWYRMVVMCPPSDGGVWEQMIGRVHREGQTQDTVFVEVYAHTETYVNAIREARKRSRFINEANGQEQKLLDVADWIEEV